MQRINSFKRPLLLAVASSALLALAGMSGALAEETVAVAEAEGGKLWFVELSGAPVADGSESVGVRSEKAAFRRAAAAAGVSYTERRSFDVLFNGFSVQVDGANRAKLTQISGVKAIYPVEVIQAPTPAEAAGNSLDLVSAITMTGANIAQNTLGLTGAGVKVGIIDTGVDIDHPDFGGSGTNGSTAFPTNRIAIRLRLRRRCLRRGHRNPVPVPDANPDDCNGHGTHVAGIVGADGADQGRRAGRHVRCVSSLRLRWIYRRRHHDRRDGTGPRGRYARRQPEHRLGAPVAAVPDRPGGDAHGEQGHRDGGFDRQQRPRRLVAGRAVRGGRTGRRRQGDRRGVVRQRTALRSSSTAVPYGYNAATGSPLPPTSGSLPMARTGTATTTDDACAALPAGSLAGQAVLIRRGTCSFFIKASNAQNAGAAAVVLYNNAAGALNPTVAGTPAITIPVVAITADQGATLNGLIAAGPTTLTWTANYVSWPYGTGGLISGFSSFGPAAGSQLEAEHRRAGRRYLLDVPAGTRRRRHVVGHVDVVAARRRRRRAGSRRRGRRTPSNAMRATPAELGRSEELVGQPGAGLPRLRRTARAPACSTSWDTIQATTVVEPSQIALGESEFGPKTCTINVKNEAKQRCDLQPVARAGAGERTRTPSQVPRTTSPGRSTRRRACRSARRASRFPPAAAPAST